MRWLGLWPWALGDGAQCAVRGGACEVERRVWVWNLVEMWTTEAPEAAGAWVVGERKRWTWGVLSLGCGRFSWGVDVEGLGCELGWRVWCRGEGMCRGAWDLVGVGIECVCAWGLGEGQW